MVGGDRDRTAVIVLVGACVASVALLLGFAAPKPRVFRAGAVGEVNVFPANSYLTPGGTLNIRSTNGNMVLLAHGADDPFEQLGEEVSVSAQPDQRYVSRLLSTPISLNWRHPKGSSPIATIIRFAGVDRQGRTTGTKIHTILTTHHGSLPVLSLVLPTGALLDPDSGLMVVGNAIFHAPEKVLTTEYKDPRWWKYPGNFHMRGKEWERAGHIQLIDTSGKEIFGSAVDVRINGQMTRAFPQHALRLGFGEPIPADLFGEEVGKGYRELVLRSAGNDQIRAMLRDAYQHELCAGLPFEVSAHNTVVLYINGAYWGVHHLRHRMDDVEIARRYGIKKKYVTILEDEARYYRGDSMQIPAFERLAERTGHWNGIEPAWADTLRSRLDVDGFLHYMATQMILANMDWPAQNVKFWRYSGKQKDHAPLDGRWYFIMGDSDLGFGIGASASTDMFQRVNEVDVPITRIFRGMMRNDEMRARFVTIARTLITGPFSAARCTDVLQRFTERIEPEMDRHTQRWRRPASVSAWQAEVDVMRTFAEQRGSKVLERLRNFEQKGK